LEINVREKDKIAEIWLTKDESNDSTLRQKLRPFYSEYRQKKYTVAVFESGRNSLYSNVESLVLHNLKA
jgi:hypothetical protein